MLKVSLLNYTPNPERTVALAMRQSHAKGSVADLKVTILSAISRASEYLKSISC